MKKTKKALASLAIAGMVLSMAPMSVFAADSATSNRIFGADRVQTAVEVAKQGWTTATTAIVAPAEDEHLVDALAAAPLAGAKNAPILLVEGKTLTTGTLDELKALGVKDVYVVGAVDAGVVTQLSGAGYNATAVKGASRMDTAAEIAKLLSAPKGSFVVGYDAIPDALSVASYAAANNYQILVANVDGTLPANEVVAGTSYVLGGPTLVKDIAGAKRVFGNDRYDTNKAILSELSYSYDKVYVANGEDSHLVDSLVASGLAGKTKSPIALTDNMAVKAAADLGAKMGSASQTIALGGPTVVADTVRDSVKYVAPATLAVESVSAINLNTIKVNFTQPVDKATAETEGNYIVDGVALVSGTDTAVLSSDKMSVTVTLDAPLTQYQTVQFETVKNGILSKDLLKGVPKYTGEVTVSDTTVPTVASVSASGNKEIDVVFSEPVLMPAVGLLDVAGSEFKLDGQNLTNYGYTSPATVPASTASGYASEIDLEFAVPLAAGSHTLTIPDGTSTQLADAAGFMVSTKTVTFTVDNVTGTPSISSITGDNNGTVKVTYDRAMADNAIDETMYTVNGTAATSASFVSGTGYKQVKLVFPTDTVAIGANVLVVNSDVEDQFGNAVGSDDIRMNFTAGEDTVKPTVSSVTVINNTTIRVKFSETVDYVFAENVANYSLKDSSATAVTVSSAVAVPTANTNSDTYNLTVAAMNGSNYTLKIKNIEDLAATPNVMDEYTATVTGSDTTDPSFVSAIQVDGSTTKVAVMFNEAMDAASLKTAANYAYIDNQGTPVTHALPSSATLTVGDGNKSVLITFPSSYTVNGAATTSYSVINIRVANVKDAAGNILDGVVATSSSIVAAASATDGQPTAVADSLKLTSDSTKVTAKISFNQAISTLNIGDFAVGAAGSEVAPDSGYVSGKDVVLNFTDATKQAAIRAAGVDAQLVTVAETSTNSYGVAIAAIASGDQVVYNDGLAPKILKTAGVPEITATAGATSSVTIQFSEAIDTSILGLYTNDFTFIQGGKVLTVTSVTSSAADSLTFNFAASAISAGDMTVKAKSTNDIKALEDQAGDQATYAPSTSDLNGYTVTAS